MKDIQFKSPTGQPVGFQKRYDLEGWVWVWTDPNDASAGRIHDAAMIGSGDWNEARIDGEMLWVGGADETDDGGSNETEEWLSRHLIPADEAPLSPAVQVLARRDFHAAVAAADAAQLVWSLRHSARAGSLPETGSGAVAALIAEAEAMAATVAEMSRQLKEEFIRAKAMDREDRRQIQEQFTGGTSDVD